MKLRIATSLFSVFLLGAFATAHAQALLNEAKLIPNPAALPYSGAGSAVAISGTTAVVGAPYGGPGTLRGSAHVFVWNGSAWTTEATLVPSDPEEEDQFGLSVAIQGNTILVGAPYATSVAHGNGAAYVFDRSGTTWTQTAKLAAPAGVANDTYSALAIALDGDTAVVGNYANTDSGRLLVFTRSGGVWNTANPQILLPHNGIAASFFGASVAIQGTFIVAGAPSYPALGQVG